MAGSPPYEQPWSEYEKVWAQGTSASFPISCAENNHHRLLYLPKSSKPAVPTSHTSLISLMASIPFRNGVTSCLLQVSLVEINPRSSRVFGDVSAHTNFVQVAPLISVGRCSTTSSPRSPNLPAHRHPLPCHTPSVPCIKSDPSKTPCLPRARSAQNHPPTAHQINNQHLTSPPKRSAAVQRKQKSNREPDRRNEQQACRHSEAGPSSKSSLAPPHTRP